MDCEKFDQHVIDALYDELDELTTAAMKRHMEGCSRCASAFSALRATREVAVLPLEEPSDELESRILFAASAAQRKTPWPKKALRALAWAGSHAMRPQLAMAAVFVLVVGSSLLLLRAKPGTTSIGPVSVTERGEPSPERDEGAQAPAAAAPMPTVVAQGAEAAPAPPEAPAVGRGAEAKADKEDQQQKERGDGASGALADARAAESSGGCDAALSKYDDIGVRFPGTPQAAEAMFSAASCHKKRGDADKARELYGVLAKRDDYKDKAEAELNDMAPNITNQQQAVAAAPTATAPPSATAAPATAAAAKPAAQAPGGAGKSGIAGPLPAPAPKAPANNGLSTDPSQAPGWGGSRGNAAAEKRKVDSSR